jgi:predicted  nucleic acid-binding Zn-ribbon protein
MKSISTILLLVLISGIGIKAQKPIVVSEDSLQYGKGRLPGLSVTIPEVNYEKTLKSWTREMQSGTKSKLVVENNEMSIFGAKMKGISPNPINVYSRMMNLDSMIKLNVAFEIKKDQYIERSTGETDLSNAKNYLKEFARNQYADLAKDQADTEDKKLRDLEKDLSSLEKEKTRLQKSIESENTSIVTENDIITVQNNELASVTTEIIEENKQLSSLSDDKMKDAKKDYINGLEKRKKKIQNMIETAQNRINKANNEIDKANAEIPRNEKMQEQVNEKIVAQQAVCQKYADKIKTIKTF